MEGNWSQITEKILNLSLEIISLLTGESFSPLKSGDHVTITVPTWDSLKPERPNVEKIVEATKKMTELLTGEGWTNLEDTVCNIVVKEEIKEEDVIEMFSEGHNDNRMETSCCTNPPQKCPRPLDSTQEDLTIPRHDQGEDLIDIKVEVKSEVEETYVRDDQRSMEEAGMMRTSEEEAGMMRTCKEEDSPSVDGLDLETMSEDHLTQSSAYKLEDEDIPQNSSGGDSTSSIHLVPHGGDGPLYHFYPEEPHTVRDGVFLQTDTVITVTESHPNEYQISHTGKKLHTCPECGRCFSKKSHLDVHLRSHTGEKPYSCPECGRRFTLQGHLSRHQKSHTGEKPYFCPDCGQRFAETFQLVAHQIDHTGEKLYSGPECGKSFVYDSDLPVHQRSHTGEKLYLCPECGKTFSKKSSLSIHERSHKTQNT